LNQLQRDDGTGEWRDKEVEIERVHQFKGQALGICWPLDNFLFGH
jgi:hypothetical protein